MGVFVILTGPGRNLTNSAAGSTPSRIPRSQPATLKMGYADSARVRLPLIHQTGIL